MASLNDHTAWAGNVDDVIALSIRPLVDMTRDNDEAGPSDTMKEKSYDIRCDHCEHYRRIERHDHR
jgi:hypothetical protein